MATRPPRARTAAKPKEKPWRRIGTPEEGFSYLRGDGKPLRSPSALARIQKLVIPPAWTDVQISPDPAAKVQVVGFDTAGRKQYRYHPDSVAKGSKRKYRKLLQYARSVPKLREETERHLSAEGLGRERVLALVVRLIMRGFFRIGSEQYAVANRTFGIATLQKKHLKIDGESLVFTYVGKKSIDQRIVVADTPLVEVMHEILTLPGKRLFQYVGEDGKTHPVTASEVNGYIKQILGAKYTSKDIRTWGGTVRMATILADLGPPSSEREAKKNVVLACKLVSTELGNTPAVCRSAYVHPAVIERYEQGKTIAPMMRESTRDDEEPGRYYPEEAALMRFLQKWG
ncbi:DNA topoisomerase IB [Longimicrobium terrae]|uniref:DNA topoisomerase n=1 Tax=Longimicrobium terrae TaxID=1639882 RepID=A0A841H258_9BACT|nr:DNA topoisomerase IB [Longimicrobium terrae]MBB4637924.1 DNA topoisomerase-1 [Longimicrobium terrae]MBB6072171.1 DNA topoisomerase-1 [Longimicrobium terrae]NNC28402.1 DNA topoisomerase IB [Longimicrobium terrae]